jgi:hypothetical protein
LLPLHVVIERKTRAEPISEVRLVQKGEGVTVTVFHEVMSKLTSLFGKLPDFQKSSAMAIKFIYAAVS